MKNDWPTAFKIFIIGMTIFAISECKKSSPKSDEEPKDESSMASIQCKEFVKERLKSPSSADFPLLDYQASVIGNNQYVIRSYVEAQNSFGANLKSNYVCIVKWNGQESYAIRNWELISLEID